MIISTKTTMQFDADSPVIEMDKDLLEFITAMLHAKGKVSAIKLFRYIYHAKHNNSLGLKYAKDIVDYIDSNPKFVIGSRLF